MSTYLFDRSLNSNEPYVMGGSRVGGGGLTPLKSRRIPPGEKDKFFIKKRLKTDPY